MDLTESGTLATTFSDAAEQPTLAAGRPVGEIAATAVLVRPDGYVAWASSQINPDSDELRELREALASAVVWYLAESQPIRSTHWARDGPGSNGAPKYCVSRTTSPSSNSMMLTT